MDLRRDLWGRFSSVYYGDLRAPGSIFSRLREDDLDQMIVAAAQKTEELCRDDNEDLLLSGILKSAPLKNCLPEKDAQRILPPLLYRLIFHWGGSVSPHLAAAHLKPFSEQGVKKSSFPSVAAMQILCGVMPPRESLGEIFFPIKKEFLNISNLVPADTFKTCASIIAVPFGSNCATLPDNKSAWSPQAFWGKRWSELIGSSGKDERCDDNFSRAVTDPAFLLLPMMRFRGKTVSNPGEGIRQESENTVLFYCLHSFKRSCEDRCMGDNCHDRAPIRVARQALDDSTVDIEDFTRTAGAEEHNGKIALQRGICLSLLRRAWGGRSTSFATRNSEAAAGKGASLFSHIFHLCPEIMSILPKQEMESFSSALVKSRGDRMLYYYPKVPAAYDSPFLKTLRKSSRWPAPGGYQMSASVRINRAPLYGLFKRLGAGYLSTDPGEGGVPVSAQELFSYQTWNYVPPDILTSLEVASMLVRLDKPRSDGVAEITVFEKWMSENGFNIFSDLFSRLNGWKYAERMFRNITDPDWPAVSDTILQSTVDMMNAKNFSEACEHLLKDGSLRPLFGKSLPVRPGGMWSRIGSVPTILDAILMTHEFGLLSNDSHTPNTVAAARMIEIPWLLSESVLDPARVREIAETGKETRLKRMPLVFAIARSLDNILSANPAVRSPFSTLLQKGWEEKTREIDSKIHGLMRRDDTLLGTVRKGISRSRGDRVAMERVFPVSFGAAVLSEALSGESYGEFDDMGTPSH